VVILSTRSGTSARAASVLGRQAFDVPPGATRTFSVGLPAFARAAVERQGRLAIDLAIARDRFHAQFAADVSPGDAALMAATQRPVAQTALEEPAGDRPLWKEIASSFVFGDLDLSIPPAALRWMAERADARQTVELAGASHALSVSRPSETAEVLLQAATRATAAD